MELKHARMMFYIFIEIKQFFLKYIKIENSYFKLSEYIILLQLWRETFFLKTLKNWIIPNVWLPVYNIFLLTHDLAITFLGNLSSLRSLCMTSSAYNWHAYCTQDTLTDTTVH